MIEVFAYWNKLPDGSFVRNGTLIVSGGCPTVIGNAVLKNPGSARPLSYEPNEVYGDRLPFRPDATMHALADLFELDRRPGTVRLFNLYDFVDTDPVMARVIVLPTSDKVLEAISSDKLPTYLGWGKEWTWLVAKEFCTNIFKEIQPRSPYLHPEMGKNPFTHPLYLMRCGNNRTRCKAIIESFQSLFLLPHDNL